MRTVHISPTHMQVFVRQSWLGTARDCMEKARWESLNTDRVSTDYAAIGTAVHAAAEVGCRDQSISEFDAVEAASQSWKDSLLEGVKFIKYDAASGLKEAQSLARSWHANMLRLVTSPRHVEEKFSTPFDTMTVNGVTVEIHLEGTMDLVQFDSLWDWKTSSKKYSWRDKQQENIQASVYAAAAVALGWLEYPVRFNFGVLLRGTNETQICTVTRDHNHEQWLRKQIRQLVLAALVLGEGNQWPTNDTGSLCSPVWCGHWDTCKGETLSYVSYPTRSKQ